MNLEKFFKQLDKSNNGFISTEELKQGIEKTYGGLAMTQSWADLVEKMDIDGNGEISYNEFLLAAANKKELLSQ